jgi:hypothetical protein
MEPQSMLAINNNSITFTPEALDLLLSYIHSFIKINRTKLEEYQRELERYRDHLPQSSVQADDTISKLQSEIQRAEVLASSFEQVRHKVQHIYNWNFVKLAEVLRKTRLHLEQAQIQDLYSLKVVLFYLMQMLKTENPMFNREKFVTYINEEGNDN